MCWLSSGPDVVLQSEPTVIPGLVVLPGKKFEKTKGVLSMGFR
jgi:hypothetical protein